MTAKQKANQLRFKKVVAEAKKLRAKNPKLTQAQAVKKAWAVKKGVHKDTKSHNVNIKVVSGVKKTKVSGWRKGKTAIIEKGEKPKKNLKNVRVTRIKKRDLFDKPGTFKRFRSIGNLPKYNDSDAAREIQLYADNDNQLYFQRRKPILTNLKKKLDKGTFNVDKAAKLWKYYIDAATQKYNKEFGSKGDKWYELLDVHDRNMLSKEYAINTLAEYNVNKLEGY